MTATPPLKVLLIAGCGRSGSTLLSATLGQVEGLVSVGELTNLWPWILEDLYPCMCARPFPECPFWSRVLDPDLVDGPAVEAVVAARQALLKQPSVRRRVRAANVRDAEQILPPAVDGETVAFEIEEQIAARRHGQPQEAVLGAER